MRRCVLLSLTFCMVSVHVFSQAVKDAGLWLGVNVEKKLSKRLELSFTEQYRLNENLTQTNLFFTDIGIAVKPFGFMKVAVSYRAIQKYQLDETYSFRHRLMMDITFRKKIGRWIPSFRQRIQTQVRNVYSSETGKLPEWAVRERFELKYDLDRPFTPYASVEWRFQLKDPRNMDLNGTWNRVRYTVGANYKINENNSVSLYYIIQCGFNIPEPQNVYITGLSYTLSL